MKRNLTTLVLLAVLLVATMSGRAQAARQVAYVGNDIWLAGYSVGIPLQDTKDYIGQTSWLGFTIEGRHFTRPNLTLGLLTGWTTFNTKDYRSDTTGNTTVTGVQARFLNIFPLLGTAHLYFGDRDGAKFYAGGGVGTYWMERKTELGLYAFTEKNWHFGVAPELGLMIPRGRTSWTLSARYNYAFSAGNVGDQSWLSVSIGFQYN